MDLNPPHPQYLWVRYISSENEGSLFPWNPLPHHHTSVTEKKLGSDFFLFCLSFLSRDMWYLHGYMDGL